eukprot:Skav210915  [mRNA]  locus=scaffold4127:11132:29640:+ [translate_table: standard]
MSSHCFPDSLWDGACWCTVQAYAAAQRAVGKSEEGQSVAEWYCLNAVPWPGQPGACQTEAEGTRKAPRVQPQLACQQFLCLRIPFHAQLWVSLSALLIQPAVPVPLAQKCSPATDRMGGTKLPSSSAFNSSVLSEIEKQPPQSLAVLELAHDATEVLRLSYAQLISWADDICTKIEAVTETFGAKRDASPGFFLVALVLDRSALALAAILAVWKAGGAYAPVPKDTPLARRRLLCFDADMVLTDTAEACEIHNCTVLLLPRPDTEFTSRRQVRQPMPEDMCMVIYTSGSTGKPKGVQCDQRCLWHSVSCFAADIGASSGTRLLWKTPYQWRTAEYELFAALCFGGTLYISPEGSQRHFQYLKEVIATHSITALTTVPSVLSLLVDHLGNCPSLKYMASVGEALPRELCRPFLEGGTSGTTVLRNYYGLTETAMTTWRCSYFPSGSVAPVGQPQPEVQVHLLLEPDARPGQEGEIYFAGIMSQGYFNMPELTRQRYHQVKLNGIRVELAEIEASLSVVCKEAAVVQAMEDAQTLAAQPADASGFDFKEEQVAFVAGAQENLADFLSQHLPLYMVPVHFIHMDGLPRLANDKVDRSLLRTRTLGLQSRAQAEAKLAAGETDEAELIKILDSLGFERLLSSKQMEMQRLCDNLSVVAMINVILFHWFWCVLIDPETYPSGRAHVGGVVAMPKLEVSGWALYLYRVATQDWAYGVFMFAAAQMSPRQNRFTSRDAAIALLYFYTGFFPMIISQLFDAPWNDIIFHAETVQRWFLLALLLGRATLVGGPVVFSPFRGFFALRSCVCPLDSESQASSDCRDLRCDLRFVRTSPRGSTCNRRCGARAVVTTAARTSDGAAAHSAADLMSRVHWACGALAPQMASQVSHGKLPAEFELPGCLFCVPRSSVVRVSVRSFFTRQPYPNRCADLRRILEKVQAVNVGPLRGICLWATMLVPVVNAAVLCFLRCEECLFRRTVPRESQQVGHLTDRVTLIIDLWGVGLSHIGFARDFLAVAVRQLVVLYPETLDRVLVVNAEAPLTTTAAKAWAFARLLWPILKQLLHPVTQRKVEIVDAGQTRDKLLEHMESDSIPTFFDGPNPGIHLGQLI